MAIDRYRAASDDDLQRLKGVLEDTIKAASRYDTWLHYGLVSRIELEQVRQELDRRRVKGAGGRRAGFGTGDAQRVAGAQSMTEIG